MGQPTDSELKQALEKAAEMREHGEDPDFVAKSLLNLNYRFNVWQRVVEATKLYLHSGQDGTEHSHLIHAFQEAEKTEATPEDESEFGLE